MLNSPQSIATMGTFDFSDQERVVFGTPFVQAVNAEIERLGVQRVLILTAPTLADPNGMATRMLDDVVGASAWVFSACEPHAPITTVLTAADAARRLDAQLLVAIGGGSVIDTAKAVQICLWNGIRTVDDFQHFKETGWRTSLQQTHLRVLAVPTTLAGAEFTKYANISDGAGKRIYSHRSIVPQVVVLDPQVTEQTPAELLLSTGFKAIDHAVETICSINGNPLAEATATHALKLLATGLPSMLLEGVDLEGRLSCQFGSWLSIMGVGAGVKYGASHGISYVLGGQFGVPHGYTSCLTLPAVLRWNYPVNAAKQDMVSQALGQPMRMPADILNDLLCELGMPTRLNEFGIHEEHLEVIAKAALQENFVKANPRPFASADELVDVLRSVL
ncbi:iron-containing alcohol dehydrogenase [Ensifer sp. ENS04]|uniref:iron-containing alcohol dehydrogenase n=1 Tax=Ensifer sp. ENS04 TaxID=2769281 RepID=UPI001786F094|nr:iron-containing alcohol dehydrogenase [Ensifer sp. ENS04]MBD9541493.1 iron-containing alcohol dehydrogenase [Ensifer sp. ENS04]